MIDLWSSWLSMALAAPAAWALVAILDLYFVRGLYQDEWDGALISGVFQLFPWLFVAMGILSFTAPPPDAILYALVGGSMFMASVFFYFRALFRYADLPMIHVLWNISVLAVPILAWAWSDERLQPIQYLGIALAFLGATLFTARGDLLRAGFLRIVWTMGWAVLLLSSSMVTQKEAYRHASNQFLDVYLIFSLGVVLAAICLATLQPKVVAVRIRRFYGFEAKYITLLLFAEAIAFSGTVFSQRAIDLSPSPSFVAAVESSVPIFIMLFSLLLASLFARIGRADASKILRSQLLGWKVKLTAILLMSSGIYCITV